jgi:hypothetical protein
VILAASGVRPNRVPEASVDIWNSVVSGGIACTPTTRVPVSASTHTTSVAAKVCVAGATTERTLFYPRAS